VTTLCFAEIRLPKGLLTGQKIIILTGGREFTAISLEVRNILFYFDAKPKKMRDK